jgi:hypothetical protein
MSTLRVCTEREARWSGCISASLLVLVVFSFHVITTGAASAQEDTSSEYKKLGDAIGKTLYFFAWPTATYERATFGGLGSTPTGVNVVFRLHGRSAFDDSYLWTDVAVQIRNWQIVDLKWGQNNAALIPPGATMKALGEALKDLNQEMTRNQRRGYPFVFENRCSHPLRLVINYQGLDGKWHSAGWWSFAAGETSTLQVDGQALTTLNGSWYSYAEATDGSGLTWQGDYRISADRQELLMSKLEDADGDREWSATCQ